MKCLIKLSVVLFYLCVGQVAKAEDQPSLVVLQLPGLTDQNDQGAYANLYNTLQERGHISSWQAAPSKRAHHIFIEQAAGCIAPASLDLLDKYKLSRDLFVISVPFNKAVGSLLLAVSPPTPKGLKPIMGVVGFGVQHGIEQGSYRVEAVEDYDKLLKLISEDRLDAAYIVHPDVMHYPDAAEKLKAYKGKAIPKWSGVDAIVCWKRYANSVSNITTYLQQGKIDGSLSRMLGKYYIE